MIFKKITMILLTKELAPNPDTQHLQFIRPPMHNMYMYLNSFKSVIIQKLTFVLQMRLLKQEDKLGECEDLR